MYLDVTLSSGSSSAVSRLTRAATDLGLAIDVQPQGGRMETKVRLHGESLSSEAALDRMLAEFGPEVTTVSRTVIR